jgi:FtsH-binding integral membrane protein
MADPKYLKVTLKLMALYAGFMGVFTMMFQSTGEVLFQYSITDPVTTRYWGGVLFAMSIFYLFLSSDPIKYRLFIWVGVFDLGIAMLLTIINLAIGSVSLVQGLVGVLVNPILLMILLYGLGKKPEGEVIMVVGGAHKEATPEMTLPPHLAGTHPLSRK